MERDLKGYKFRMYPTKAQMVMLNKHLGCSRFLYNYMLQKKIEAYQKDKTQLTSFDLINLIPTLKKEKEYEWLNEVDSQSLQQAIIDMCAAYKNFFKKNASFPRFKKKSIGDQKFRSPHGYKIFIKGKKVFLPKMRDGIEFVQHNRQIIGGIISATISKTPSGKYYISLLVEDKNYQPKVKPAIKAETAVGIDLGLKSFAVTSEGNSYSNPRYLKNSLQRLKVLQRRLARRKKGSVRRGKLKKQIAILHEYIANQRKDFLHKTSTELVKNHDTICIEDLAVKNMMKNHNLAQAISDVGWGMFRTMLTYKCDWYGKNLLIMPRFEASTKVCSCCGARNETLTLKDRGWTCANCETHHDRDINAAKVMKQYCLTNRDKSGKVIPVEPVESSAIVEAVKQESCPT